MLKLNIIYCLPLFHTMAGWLEYSILLGASTVLTIILKKLNCKYYDNALTIEMVVEVTRKVSQSSISKLIHCK